MGLHQIYALVCGGIPEDRNQPQGQNIRFRNDSRMKASVSMSRPVLISSLWKVSIVNWITKHEGKDCQVLVLWTLLGLLSAIDGLLGNETMDSAVINH